MSRSLVIAALALAMILAVAGCGGGGEKTVVSTVTQTTPTTAQTTTSGEVGDVQAATAVLSRVIDRAINDTSYATQAFRDDPDLTPALVSKVQQLGKGGLDFEPFLCAQNIPQSVSYHPARVAGDNMTINGTFDYGGPTKPVEVTYGMVLQDGAWKLDSTNCVEQALSP